MVLALKDLHSSALFDGEDGNKIFSHNIDLLEKERYRMAGRLVALSFAQEGPGPHFFNDSLFDIMTETWQGISDQSLSNVLQDHVKQLLEQLANMDSADLRDTFLSEHGDWLTDQGIPNVWRLTISQKKEMSEMLVKQMVYYRTSSEVSQFTSGMNDVGLFWDIVKKIASLFKPLFCRQTDPITSHSFEDLCNINYSEEGSNKRMGEDETNYSWERFLLDIADGNIPVTFEELLAFISGADKIPPCGFSKKIDVRFYEQEEGVNRFPYVSTCSLELYLPRSMDDPVSFKALMLRSLKESLGFEKI